MAERRKEQEMNELNRGAFHDMLRQFFGDYNFSIDFEEGNDGNDYITITIPQEKINEQS
tara:strand:+ start:124 stop:300 length:177 start_codon:yes stop_codon:yes gene_type:complete